MRAVSLLSVIFISVSFFGMLGRRVIKKPMISSISPLIGAPGDEMIIKGKNFGNEKSSSYVEIAGSRVTSSGYKSWTDNEISLVLPSNVQDGLIFVSTYTGTSDPFFFANEKSIPVALQMNTASVLPKIESISSESAKIGDRITISGVNFGEIRGKSKVYFTANRDDNSGYNEFTSTNDVSKLYIPADENDFDYVSWSDNEIVVKVPDGAATGSVFVETASGSSSSLKLSVKFPCGKKSYKKKITYVVQNGADISVNSQRQESFITLYVPKPAISSLQPYSQLNDVFPEPFYCDDPYFMIHKKSLNHIQNNNQKFSQTYVVSVYSQKTDIDPKKVVPYEDRESLFYKKYVEADACIPSTAPSVVSLAQNIVGNQKNVYLQAKLIYDYFCENYEVLDKIRTGNAQITDLVQKKKGDSYDFAMLYASALRSLGIMANPVSGILVHGKSNVVPHWWTEVYFAGYGWFPVDVVLGAGLEFSPFSSVGDHKSFYFGNMDNQHIAFSRGYHQIKQEAVNSVIVYNPRAYALQSIWEEAGDLASSYSSLWNVPVILGIY